MFQSYCPWGQPGWIAGGDLRTLLNCLPVDLACTAARAARHDVVRRGLWARNPRLCSALHSAPRVVVLQLRGCQTSPRYGCGFSRGLFSRRLSVLAPFLEHMSQNLSQRSVFFPKVPGEDEPRGVATVTMTNLHSTCTDGRDTFLPVDVVADKHQPEELAIELLFYDNRSGEVWIPNIPQEASQLPKVWGVRDRGPADVRIRGGFNSGVNSCCNRATTCLGLRQANPLWQPG